MKSEREIIHEMALGESDETKLKKAHAVWRKSMDKIFLKRRLATTGKKEIGDISKIGDNEMMRMLDNIGWGARDTDKIK